jgi:hypothetical protein
VWIGILLLCLVGLSVAAFFIKGRLPDPTGLPVRLPDVRVIELPAVQVPSEPKSTPDPIDVNLPPMDGVPDPTELDRTPEGPNPPSQKP